ncbi:coiled-coil domain-containing protein 71-like [Heterodontus francisci]|uniref:coiled-coil domain-containing protein 71-like n=1 Tax=Heterodontus francisci TaxID=7792 RepID=UPI00355B8125
MAQQPEGPAVQAWSRIPVVGPRALEDALTVFSPMSPDLLQSQRQLLSFVQGLREEGYLPTVLRSRDVYGYTSCTCQVPAPRACPNPGGGGGTGNTSSSAPGCSSSSARTSNPAASDKAARKTPKCNGWLRPPASSVRLGSGSRTGERAGPGWRAAGEARKHRYPERKQQQQLAKQEPGAKRKSQPELAVGRPDSTEGRGQPCKTRLQLLRSKVIKVDDSSSDEEVRRKAQKILRVNLSPVIKIRPITYPN